MSEKDKLYDTFGELIYVVAMADGAIQPSELSKLEEILASHPWASQIKWSFDYEVDKKQSLDDVYKKVVSYCQSHGPAEEYAELLDVIKKVAEASDGIDIDESRIIESFQKDLIDYFQDHYIDPD